HEEDEHGQGLDQDDPPGIIAEGVQPRFGVQSCRTDDSRRCHFSLPALVAVSTGVPLSTARDTTVPVLAPRSRRTAQPAALVGSHTTRSGISVMTAGRRTAPAGPSTRSVWPSARPISA